MLRPIMSTHADVVADLTRRWPEQQIAPSLARIEALVALLGDPHRSCPVVHITGTNGKGSTGIIVDALLRAQGLRTGRYSSPHLADPVERICIDGEPISAERFDEAWADIAPYVEMVDAMELDGVAMTFFEVMTGLAFAVFADTPVDVMVLEVGMGGAWDATNIADADVAVVTPIDIDHTSYLGATAAEIAHEKAGIIKPDSVPVLAGQSPEVATVLMSRCAEMGVAPLREGVDFGVLDRTPAVAGQVLRLDTVGGAIGDLHLPLYGAHMARNAALAVAAVEALSGGRPLDPELISDAFGIVEAPARTELVRTSPAIVLDTCHNPHGARATMAAMTEAYGFTPLIGVVGMMADKDVEGTLAVLVEDMAMVVCTRAATGRAIDAEALADVARGIVGDERVVVRERLDDAIETAAALADEAGAGAGVLVCGSVALAGQARGLLATGKKPSRGGIEVVVGDDPSGDVTTDSDREEWA
jgi:dihydrofolate synthase/folylpolyglutamate synthase